MRKSIAEASEFRHILPDAVPGGGEGVHESRAGHVDEVFARKRSKYAVGTGAAPPSRRVFPKRHTIDVSNTESPYFYYILSGTVRLAYVGANGEERTILYAGAGTLMNVPTIIAGDIKNTVVTCTERVEAAIFDAGLLTDRAFAAARPDLLLNLIHSLCIHLVIHSQHLGDASLVGTMGHVCRVFQEMSQKYGGRPRFSPDMTQQELAALLGIHRTTLTRILCRLKALNIIEKYTKNDLHILDMEALDRLARGDKR